MASVPDSESSGLGSSTGRDTELHKCVLAGYPALDQHPIPEGDEMLLVSLCYGNRDKLPANVPPGNSTLPQVCMLPPPPFPYNILYINIAFFVFSLQDILPWRHWLLWKVVPRLASTCNMSVVLVFLANGYLAQKGELVQFEVKIVNQIYT